MNSSGIKRGLATTAVSALAIAGLPLFASSASAADGDVITVASVGPARDGGSLGAEIVFETKGLTEAEVNDTLADPNNSQLKVVAQDLTNPATNALQTIGAVDFVSFVADASDNSKFGKNDGFDEVTVRIPVDTRTTGDTARFAVYVDDDGAGTAAIPDVDSTEAAVNVAVQTSGAPASLVAAPTFQSTPVGVDSGDYVVTLRDSENRITQLSGTEVIEFDLQSGPAGGVLTTDPVAGWNAAEVGNDGVFPFSASGSVAGLYRIRAGAYATAATVDPFASTIVNLDVNGATADAASIAPEELNLVTGADNRAGFNQGTSAAQVRPDQTSITFEIDDNGVGAASQANKVVQLTAGGGNVTFGGQPSETQRVLLDANGKGSVTFTVDAASIQAGDVINVTGGSLATQPFVITYAAPALTAATTNADQDTYLSAFRGTVNPVFTIKDQYGNPIQGLWVSYELEGGPNDTNTQSARVETDANGQVTFAITDAAASATNRAPATIRFRTFDGRLSANQLDDDATQQIVYSADGQGADFLLTVDGQTPGSAAYNPKVVPVTDGIGESDAERGTLLIVGGTSGSAATVTVDNGARILGASNNLSDATASKTGLVGDTYQIVGTTEGVVNVTVTSGGKTQTATLTVEAPANNATTARNIELEGPEGAVAGDVVEFTATITDAFGNPVTGYDDAAITDRITGPGNEQGTSGDSDVNGEITYFVEITQGASNPVTLRLEATGAQFGAGANELAAVTPPTQPTAAPGLSASNDSASATVEVVDIEELEQALADAQAVLADRQAELAAATADLDVAQAQLAIAQAEVDRLQERKQNLRQKLNKAKRNDNMQKAKTTRKKLRAVKRQLNDARDAVVVAQTRVDGQQTVVDLREQAVTAAEEAVAEAQADLDEAQN